MIHPTSTVYGVDGFGRFTGALEYNADAIKAASIKDLLDTELAELACAGSHAPVEDILGRMKELVNK